MPFSSITSRTLRRERTAFAYAKLGGVAVFHHDLEAQPHELDGPAVEDLLLEVVPLGLVLEGKLHHAGPRGPDRLCDCQDDLPRIPRGVVLDADAPVDALPLLVLLPNESARGVGNEEHRVHILRRPDGAIEDVEPVAEAQGLARRAECGAISAA